MPRYASVAEFVAALPPHAVEPFHELYGIVKAAAPDAAEVIKWNQPMLEGRRIYFGFAAFKDHMDFTPTSKTLAEFADELDAAGIAHTTGLIKLRYDVPLPADLIRRIAERRVWDVDVNDARFAAG